MNQTLMYRLRKLKVLLFLVALVLSVYGSYQVYHGTYDTLFKEVMVILYSTFKLFTFSPTLGITNESPLAYEMAIWIAPAFTMVGFFTIFEKAYEALKFKLFHLGKESLLIMGDNQKALEFIKNISDEDPKRAMALVCDLSDEVQEDIYKAMKVHVIRLDFSNPKNRVNELIIRDQNLFASGRIISFEEEPLNYTRIEALYLMVDLKEEVEVYLETENFRIKELMEKRMDALYYFDIHYFNVEELLIKYLFERSSFKANLPEKLKAFKGKKNSLQEISESVGHMHFLIIGYSSITESLLLQAANRYTINPLEDLKVTLVTREPEKVQDFVEESRGFSNAIDLNVLSIFNKRELEARVREIHEREPFQALFFTSHDLEKNILHLDALADCFQETPLGIFVGEEGDLSSIVESLKLRHPRITRFGDIRGVLKKDFILEERLYEEAKAFNASYQSILSEQMGFKEESSSKEDQWLSLSTIKKESSVYQSAHADTKGLLLDIFSKEMGTTSEALLEQWNRSLKPLSYEEKVAYVRKDPYLNYLSALEHKRWNNFYYLRDFIYDPVKDELKKTHNCLIDDWERFYDDDLRDKLFYDTLSTLLLKGKGHGKRD